MNYVLLLIVFLVSISANALNEIDKQSIFSKNLLQNGGFESSKAKWSLSAGSFSVTTSSPMMGNVHAVWDATASGEILSSAAVAIPSGMYGRNGVASCLIKVPSGSSTQELQAHDGTNVLVSVSITSSTLPVRTSANFVFPSSGNISLRLYSNADEPSISIDDCYLGPAEGFNVETAGADQQLSNLSGTTAMPVDLIFTSAADRMMSIDDIVAGAGKSLTIKSGSTTESSQQEGPLILSSGNGVGVTPLDDPIQFWVAKPSGAAATPKTLYKGGWFSPGASSTSFKVSAQGATDGDANLFFTASESSYEISAGTPLDGTSASLPFNITAMGSTTQSNSGSPIALSTQTRSTGAGSTGNLTLSTGVKSGTTIAAKSGDVTLSSGENSISGAGVSDSGAVSILSGAITNTANTGSSGKINIKTGLTTSTSASSFASGDIDIITGASASTGHATGDINIKSGNSSGWATGTITISAGIPTPPFSRGTAEMYGGIVSLGADDYVQISGGSTTPSTIYVGDSGIDFNQNAAINFVVEMANSLPVSPVSGQSIILIGPTGSHGGKPAVWLFYESTSTSWWDALGNVYAP